MHTVFLITPLQINDPENSNTAEEQRTDQNIFYILRTLFGYTGALI